MVQLIFKKTALAAVCERSWVVSRQEKVGDQLAGPTCPQGRMVLGSWWKLWREREVDVLSIELRVWLLALAEVLRVEGKDGGHKGDSRVLSSEVRLPGS